MYPRVHWWVLRVCRPACRLLAAVAGMTAVHVMDSAHTKGSTIGRMRMGAQDSIASSQAYRGRISGTVLDLAQARLPGALARGSLFRPCMWRTGTRSLDFLSTASDTSIRHCGASVSAISLLATLCRMFCKPAMRMQCLRGKVLEQAIHLPSQSLPTSATSTGILVPGGCTDGGLEGLSGCVH